MKLHQLNIIKKRKKHYKKASEKYQSLPIEEKEKKWKHGNERIEKNII